MASKNDAHPSVESLRYEEASQELRTIVADIESGRLPLDDSLRAFQRGTQLLGRCRQLLDDAELKVREVTAKDLSAPRQE